MLVANISSTRNGSSRHRFGPDISGWWASHATGQPVVNGHVKTVVKLALDLAGPLMAKKGLELISPQQGSLLVDRVMRGLRKPGEGYLWRLSPSVRLAETVFRAVQALRLAGLHPEELSVDCFEVDIKGHELREILKHYLLELRAKTGSIEPVSCDSRSSDSGRMLRLLPTM